MAAPDPELTGEDKTQKVASLGIATKTHPQCKVCNSPHRGRIEDVLVLRSRGETLPDPMAKEMKVKLGTKPTETFIFNNSERLWGFKMNRNNIYGHFKNHFRTGDPRNLGEVVEQDVRTRLMQDIRENGIQPVNPDDYLDTIIAIGAKKVELDPASVTAEMAMKAVDLKTKRKADEQTASLMGGLIAGMNSALKKVPDAVSDEAVDAEVVDATPVESGGSASGPGGGEGHPPALGAGDEAA